MRSPLLRRYRVPPNIIGRADRHLTSGHKFRILTEVDTFARFSPVIDPFFICQSENVVEPMEQIRTKLLYSRIILVDLGAFN